ncbi:MAG: hypothetical protein HY765_08130 [Rhodomicrobium sp.]|nr:hypothetical protein [Rhodomicrobium sp.]
MLTDASAKSGEKGAIERLRSGAAGVEALVAASDVSLAFRGKPVLDRVSIAVHPGEIVTLIGPNGAVHGGGFHSARDSRRRAR